MRNIFFYVTISILFILVTFFGLGPVIFADGSTSERVITLIIVLLVYTLITSVVVYFIKKKKNVKRK